MKKQNAELKEIVIKAYPHCLDESGMFLKTKFKEVDPAGYAKVYKHYKDGSGLSVMISILRKNGLVGAVNIKGAVTALVPASRQTSLKDTSNGHSTTIDPKELILQCLAHYNGSKFGVKQIQIDLPQVWAQLETWGGGNASKIRQKIYSVRQSKRWEKIKNSSRVIGDEPDPEPVSQMNFCPHCGFQVGLVIKAVNTITRLKR